MKAAWMIILLMAMAMPAMAQGYTVRDASGI
jgi:hypothetical protein